MEKRMIEVKYEVVGGKRTDFIIFYAKNVLDAIERFKNHEFEISGIKHKYNEYSIVSVE